jgi:hypothetical protein
MGYQLGRVYDLRFGGAMDGAEVKIRSTTVGRMLQLRQMIEDEDVPGLVDMLTEHLIEWNLEDPAGDPVPMTVEGLLANLEEPVLGVILREWYKAATGVTAPLDGPSTSSGPSLEESIPMETLSASPAS